MRRYIVIDLAFTIEPREGDTLPEVILGCARLSRIDVARPPLSPAEAHDCVLGTHGEPHGMRAGGGGDAEGGGAAGGS
jgi:hypothetical protein